MDVKRRRYNSPQRDEQANATRQQILRAAERLFARQGFMAATLRAIAREADVSLATVYLYFSGRAAIVSALAEEVVSAADLSVEQVLHRGEPIDQVRVGVRVIRTLNERSWLITDILRSFRGGDEELTRLWALWQERHLDAVRRATMAIAASGGLRAGLTIDEAADVLYAVAGTEVYRALVHDRGWTPERYESWLFEFGRRELLGM